MEQILNKNGVSKVFPNGFTSWAETHAEICMEIGRRFVDDDFGEGNTELEKAQAERGTGGVWELAEDLTDEFEKKFGVETENYYEELENFMIEKL